MLEVPEIVPLQGSGGSAATGRASMQGGGSRAGEQDWGAEGIGGIVHAGRAALPDRDDIVTEAEPSHFVCQGSSQLNDQSI